MQSNFDSYVRSALALQGYDFGDQQIAEITLQFSRFAALAATFADADLPPTLEPAPVFRP